MGKRFRTNCSWKKTIYSKKVFKTLDGASYLETMPSESDFTNEVAREISYDAFNRVTSEKNKLTGKNTQIVYSDIEKVYVNCKE